MSGGSLMTVVLLDTLDDCVSSLKVKGSTIDPVNSEDVYRLGPSSFSSRIGSMAPSWNSHPRTTEAPWQLGMFWACASSNLMQNNNDNKV